ncbi:centriole, cilia and spindle-associated protein [Varanus komodoensis]|uniref:centriole, cilia and spindle-associated protein n=1 Tax=Varanus komodoensis TaxID=61221 RepID=UPI001CF790A9|nr:centriole, cilia and spindle-associated protein [Varanus komodoensis]
MSGSRSGLVGRGPAAVPSRGVKSEYMKRFKEPKWEACGPCYQELLRYRLSRRLLEQAHRPWFWDGWEQDSSLSGSGSSSGGGGRGSPSPPGTLIPSTAQQREEEAAGAEAASEPALGRTGDVSREAAARSSAEQLHGSEEEDHEKTDKKGKVERDETKSAEKGTSNAVGHQREPPLNRTASGTQGERRRAKSPQRTDLSKGLKHPFALYGWGEKQTDTGSQKTHNVCASASVNEIHESAIRAKNRRQMEKRKLAQRRIHTAEVERSWKAKPSGPDNPWMTEYMRCYSARAR